MKKALFVVLLAAACAKNEPAAPAAAAAAPEKTYPMTATIVSRNPAAGTVNLDNEDVPGVMSPMKMDYGVRGVKVEALPPDGTAVTVTLHEQDGDYWVTDVKPKPPAAPAPPATST